MRNLFFLWVIILVFSVGCARPNMRDSLAQVPSTPEGNPMLLAIYEPWFGEPSHINVGYSSQDPVVIRMQIDRAQAMNIQGFVVNWYGPHHAFEDHAYELMQQAAAEKNFKVAVQYDEAVDHPGSNTDVVIGDLEYLHDRYIGPKAAPSRTAYLRYQGKPVIFIFPKDSTTDWNRVRQVTQSWDDPPLLIYKDQSQKYGGAFDGAYAWVNPGARGWTRDGSHFGEDYLNYFYNDMIQHHPEKIAVGAVWPGFDDSRASWSQNRHMSYRCGRTFEDTLHIFRRFYGTQNAPPFLLIETWNDYEEGTDVERGISHCGNSRAAYSTAFGAGR